MSEKSLRAMRSGGYRSIAPEDMNYDMLIENRWLIAGSPETVREQLRDSIEQLGTGRVILSFTTGVKPRWMVDKTLQLFSEQVLPHFRGRGRALVDEAPRAGYTNRLEYAVKRREDAPAPSAIKDGELVDVTRAHLDGVDARI